MVAERKPIFVRLKFGKSTAEFKKVKKLLEIVAEYCDITILPRGSWSDPTLFIDAKATSQAKEPMYWASVTTKKSQAMEPFIDMNCDSSGFTSDHDMDDTVTALQSMALVASGLIALGEDQVPRQEVTQDELVGIRDVPHDNQGPCTVCHRTFCGALRLTLGYYHDGAAKTVDLCFACALKLKNVMVRVI